MKMAIVHDYLCGLGGSERVFQYMCEEFLEADIYTLAYNANSTYPYFRQRQIATTWLNPFVRTMESFRWSFPLATYAMEQLDLRRYDIVLSSSATVAKYVFVPNGKHLCYCYIPTRAIWQFADYFGLSWKANLVKPLLPYLRRRDYLAAQRVDEFIAISETTKAHIRDTYDRDSAVIHSPIDLKSFRPSVVKKEHFLIVSRLEQWKRVDYAIEAFNRLGMPLRIVGAGNEEARLRAMAGPNISFLGAVSDETLAREYGEARAVIFTPFLEYGLIPLEANASGTPVICLGKGGITETMIAHEACNDGRSPTAVFFHEQSADSLIEAVMRFEHLKFDVPKLVEHAAKWDVPAFKAKIRNAISSAKDQKIIGDHPNASN